LKKIILPIILLIPITILANQHIMLISSIACETKEYVKKEDGTIDSALSRICPSGVGTLFLSFDGYFNNSGIMELNSVDSQSSVRPIVLTFKGLTPWYGRLIFTSEEIAADDENKKMKIQRYEKGKYSFSVEYNWPDGNQKTIIGMINYNLGKPKSPIEFSIIVTETSQKSSYVYEYKNVTGKMAKDVIMQYPGIQFGNIVHDDKAKPADLSEEILAK